MPCAAGSATRRRYADMRQRQGKNGPQAERAETRPLNQRGAERQESLNLCAAAMAPLEQAEAKGSFERSGRIHLKAKVNVKRAGIFKVH